MKRFIRELGIPIGTVMLWIGLIAYTGLRSATASPQAVLQLQSHAPAQNDIYKALGACTAGYLKDEEYIEQLELSAYSQQLEIQSLKEELSMLRHAKPQPEIAQVEK